MIHGWMFLVAALVVAAPVHANGAEPVVGEVSIAPESVLGVFPLSTNRVLARPARWDPHEGWQDARQVTLDLDEARATTVPSVGAGQRMSATRAISWPGVGPDYQPATPDDGFMLSDHIGGSEVRTWIEVGFLFDSEDLL
ncbi:MAG: hypothetical protein ACR2PQ_00470, partial [Myxococcota bacterium]